MTSGWAALDAALPGGGWPIGTLIEVMQSEDGVNEWRLLAPVLARLSRLAQQPTLLIGAPYPPFGPSLAAHGIDPVQLLWIQGETAAARSWACVQALQCADVAAVLAWLPQARPEALRRLQIAAQEHQKLLFVFRPGTASRHSSAAPLRLQVEPSPQDDHLLEVRILKRRGPPQEAALLIPTRAARLAGALSASRTGKHRRRTSMPTVLPDDCPTESIHGMDRPVTEPTHG